MGGIAAPSQRAYQRRPFAVLCGAALNDWRSPSFISLKRSLAVKGAGQAYNRPEIAALPPSCRQIAMASCGIRQARVRGTDAHRKSTSQR
jgi:hypothetical protein